MTDRRGRLSSTGPRARTSTMPPDSTTRPVPTGSGPVRTCVGCRQRDLRSALLRLVLDRSGAGTDEPRLVVDAGRSLPGRGAWLHASTRCLETAERRRAVPRALRVAGPLDLAAVRAAIEARPGEHL
ncbi:MULTISPECIES: YlxR family protein [Cellulosimicrobium]|uniref:YlxR family protein n=1 Tax=Cellulosimicrobium TaxID=157920 RepID=UPI000A3218B6|nr:YlxR family protein [Cellulosimicrobium sp. XJ-DQ-B-000]MBE9928050.1 YlxR family protein [Cellulosimicrobium cellulans]MBE9940572.1 YlxR family protein [Cellulosimicrobium cellulans]MDQ8040373.1 YlxR family protein [Cellulosimicrobium sp. XJ-DQ-B-000]QUC01072.1 YlxR family protein [Cellulosimicrobium cellulans]